jgi:hypothetical protein
MSEFPVDDMDKINESVRKSDVMTQGLADSLSSVLHYIASLWPEGYQDSRFTSEIELVTARAILKAWRDDNA